METPGRTKPPAEPDYSQVKAKISLKAFMQAAIFRAEHDIRDYLNGIRVDRAEGGGTYVIGSDGLTMLVYHDAEGVLDGADSIIVRAPRAAVVAAGAASRRKTLPQAVIVEGKRLSIAPDFGLAHHDELELYVQPGSCQIEVSKGSGPNKYEWRRVLPKFELLRPAMFGSVNPKFLERLNKAARVGLPPSVSCGVRFWQEDANTVVAAQLDMHRETLVLIMPMRMGDESPAPLLKRLSPTT